MSFELLTNWYQRHHRKLPFRESHDPYHIWISEIMLQQTQVQTVLPYYEKFIQRFKTIEALASASLEEVLLEVKGLGYYRRFKLLHQAAKIIQTQFHGQFPNRYDEVFKLPGIGHYTSGAIMSIAFQQPFAAVDGNVLRVWTRLFQMNDDISLLKTQLSIKQQIETHMTQHDPRILTQALMELGALICQPTTPKCRECPLASSCQSFQENTQLNFPVKLKKVSKKEMQYITLILTDGNDLVIETSKTALFEHMHLLPQYDDESIYSVIERLESKGYSIIDIKDHGIKKHVFTHQVWWMHVYQITISQLIGTEEKMPIDQMKQLIMPKAHEKLLTLIHNKPVSQLLT
jgi:A/G-specific adenine glycosylase